MVASATERFELALQTAAGQVTAAVDVPTGFVPVAAIVPVMHRLGEEAQALEVTRLRELGQAPSCQKGCAACCRMLVPVSIPEAFALRDWIRSCPVEEQVRISTRLSHAKSQLLSHELWQRLADLCEEGKHVDEQTLEEVNRAYYALRIPCPFLTEEACTIYEQRPSACRELLVTSPPDRCDDVITNPVEPIPVPIQMSTVLGLLWQELAMTSTRLIPLPLILDWTERHEHESARTWRGAQLLDQALEKAWRFLSQSVSGSSGINLR